jgi:anti-sigma B factor antagonist
MEVSELGNGTQVKVALSGRLDSPGVDRMEARFVGAIVPGGKPAVVDLSQVEFIASLGVRMLISAARALAKRGGRLVLFGATEPVREVFDNISLGEIIPIRDNEADAIAALNA